MTSEKPRAGLVETTRRRLVRAIRFLQAVPHRGRSRHCPICQQSSRHFLPHGNPPRPEALCPHCRSLERHRFAWLYLQTETGLFDGEARRMLHFAPERSLEPRLRQALGSGYVTADLSKGRFDVTVDVTDIGYPDNSFDAIICSHVLEHVPDDRTAMRELARIVTEDGWILLMVPIRGPQTDEDPDIIDPIARAERFGQADHVRLYGEDFTTRLEEAGLEVSVVSPGDIVSEHDVRRMGLGGYERRLFVATPRRQPQTGAGSR